MPALGKVMASLLLCLFTMLPILLLPFAIAALVLFSSHYVIFRRLLSLALQLPGYRITPLAAAPSELTQLAAPTLQKLQALGFQPIAACEITPLIYQGGATEWELLLAHNHSFAHIALRHPLEAYAPTKVTFYSFLQNQHLLLTLNGEAHGLIGQLPNTTVADAYSPDLNQQWQHHQQLIEQAPEPLQSLTPKRYAQQLTHHFSHYLAQLKQRGQLQCVAQPTTATNAPQLFQLSISTALTCCKNIATQSRKATTLAKALAQASVQQAWTASASAETFSDAPANSPNERPLPVQNLDNLPITTQVQSFERMQRMERGSIQRPGCDRWLFFASLILFMVSFRQMFDPVGLLSFVGALALHEGGHHWAMRCFGYENTTIFFLPFFGAAATGHKDKASLFEKVCVLLAGPIPGILLGSILLYCNTAFPQLSGSDWLHEASIILLGLNFFNLLPIYPLDGGKVVHLLFFSRLPYWDILFKIIAVCCLLFLSLLSPILLALAAVVALSIPQSFRSAKLYSALQQPTATPLNHPQDYLKQIFQHQQSLGYHRLPFSQRYSLTKDLWERRGVTQAKWPTYLALGLLYLLFLIGAPTGFILAQLTGVKTATTQSLSSVAATDITSSSKIGRP